MKKVIANVCLGIIVVIAGATAIGLLGTLLWVILHLPLVPLLILALFLVALILLIIYEDYL